MRITTRLIQKGWRSGGVLLADSLESLSILVNLRYIKRLSFSDDQINEAQVMDGAGIDLRRQMRYRPLHS